MRIQHIFSEAADTSALALGKPEAFLAAIVSTAGWRRPVRCSVGPMRGNSLQHGYVDGFRYSKFQGLKI
jgi:hypothetical protein